MTNTKTILLKIIKIIILILVLIAVISIIYINVHPTFGGKPDMKTKERIENSQHFDGKKFNNLMPTTIIEKQNVSDKFSIAKNIMFPPTGKNPSSKIKSEQLEAKKMENEDFAWLGHSTVLFKTSNKTIITDPVFYNAAPVSFVQKPFEMTNKPATEDLPYIDVVLISHDHYDHLDYNTIKEISSNVGAFYVPLGVKAHLQRWGVSDEKIVEFDWYDEVNLDDIQFVFTPSRHFSGRSINDRCKTLWGSWVIISPTIKIYFSGDGGYSDEFKKIGEMFDGFDIAFMECGAYNKSWQNIHMFPEQTAQAIIDVKAKVAMPIHWGKFDLSTHKWNESPEKLLDSIEEYNRMKTEEEQIKITTPKIAEIFNLSNLPSSKWWEN